MTLSHGDTVPTDGPLMPRSELRRFLLALPLADYLPPVVTGEGIHISFLQVIPVFESEAAYKSESSVEALMHRWREQGVKFWDPNRRPMSRDRSRFRLPRFRRS